LQLTNQSLLNKVFEKNISNSQLFQAIKIHFLYYENNYLF